MSKKLTTEIFIERAEIRHGVDTYDYSESNYINLNTKIKIICPEHGPWYPLPNNFLSGAGCQTCARKFVGNKNCKGVEHFIEKSQEVHGNLYDYSNAVYINNKTKLEVICPIHGSFLTIPSNHTRGAICFQCKNENNAGFALKSFIRKYSVATFYIISCANDNESFIKIGMTGQTLNKRFNNTATMPYRFIMLHQIKTDSQNVWNIEHDIKKKLRAFKYKPLIDFGGKTECYTQEALPEIKNYLFNF